MSRLINTTTMTVDGVTDVADWFVSEGGHDRAARDQFVGEAGMVMGRTTYEGLAAYWSQQTGEWADLLNPMPKFVASRTLRGDLGWNATALDGDVLKALSALKSELDGDLFLIGCGELARHLIANGLVDELRFWLHPTVWGDGTRPYQGDTIRMRLLEAASYDSGVVLLRFEPLTTS
ncbi:MAG TPA: dihydrofolate reductase family protein [Gaiellaceae bacterium]|nr:dihydrofolate reductase family protein [Gaiellaceae bacterium]HET8652264.1 dihydrofolate reductase family protein [Gaiellaceae bacterium]